jgi:LysR family transcriptional regulator, glycine cleavage system transcriptional activator
MPHRRRARVIRGLHYFEVVARHQSISAAAAELGVTAGAVSHQLREPGQKLGEQLLTKAGARRGFDIAKLHLFEMAVQAGKLMAMANWQKTDPRGATGDNRRNRFS